MNKSISFFCVLVLCVMSTLVSRAETNSEIYESKANDDAESIVYTFNCDEDVLEFGTDAGFMTLYESEYDASSKAYTINIPTNSDRYMVAVRVTEPEQSHWTITDCVANDASGNVVVMFGVVMIYTFEFTTDTNFDVTLAEVRTATVSVNNPDGVDLSIKDGDVLASTTEGYEFSFVASDFLEITPSSGYQVVSVTVNDFDVAYELLPSESSVEVSLENVESGSEIKVTVEEIVAKTFMYRFDGPEGLVITRNGVAASEPDSDYPYYEIEVSNDDYDRWSIRVEFNEDYAGTLAITDITYNGESVGIPRNGGEYWLIDTDYLNPDNMMFVVRCENVTTNTVTVKVDNAEGLAWAMFTGVNNNAYLDFVDGEATVNVPESVSACRLVVAANTDYVVKALVDNEGNEQTVPEDDQTNGNTYEFEVTISDGAEFNIKITSWSGVKVVEADGKSSESVYNLQGVRVNPENIGSGIYVVDGRKVVVR